MELEPTGSMGCYGCGRALDWGEPYVSVNYHVERTEEPGFIEVEQAESMLVACIDCAPSRSAIATALAEAGFPVHVISDDR